MPSEAEAYGVGVMDRGWLDAVFEGRSGTNSFARLVVGAKTLLGAPEPNVVIPHIHLFAEFPVGTNKNSYMIFNNFGMLTFRGYSADGLTQKDLLQFDFDTDLFAVGGHFKPTMAGAWDLGSIPPDDYRWRDISLYGWLFLGDITNRGISLPSPTSSYRLAGIGTRGGTGVKDNYQICRKRTAGDYKWLDIFDKFQSVSLLKDVEGITKTDIGTTGDEILFASHRSKVDLTYFDRCRAVFGGINNEAAIFYCKIQYSTNQTAWSDLTPEGASDGTANEQICVGNWGNIPIGALSDVFIRAYGRAATSTADPTYKTIELQVR